MSLYLGDIPIANDGSHGINTPFFFGQSMYSENAPYNASWLASNGQYNASTLYPDFWTQLTGVELNNSLNVGDTIEIGGKTYVKRGLPVVLSTGTITDYDFVVNQNDQTFRLPLLNGEEDLPSEQYETWTLGNSGQIYPITKNGFLCLRGIAAAAATDYLYISQCEEAGTIDAKRGVVGLSRGAGLGGNVQLYLSKGSYAYVEYVGWSSKEFTFNYAKGNGTLYYYVGDTIQDASLINAGAVLGQLSNKADIDASNFNASGKSLLSGLGKHSSRYEDWTLLASDNSYTAPANGHILFGKAGTSTGQVIQFIDDSGTLVNVPCAYNGHIPILYVDVRKGQTFTISYNVAGTTSVFRFIYDVGEN